MNNENEIMVKAIEAFMYQVKINQRYGKDSLIYFADNYIKELRQNQQKELKHD